MNDVDGVRRWWPDGPSCQTGNDPFVSWAQSMDLQMPASEDMHRMMATILVVAFGLRVGLCDIVDQGMLARRLNDGIIFARHVRHSLN